MRFVQIQGGDIVEGKMGAFLEWLNANEEALAAAHPDGAEYMGTYFAVASSEKSAGSVYWLVGMDSYGTQDVLAADRGELNRLINEVVGFIDQSNSANGSQILLKKATEATTYGN